MFYGREEELKKLNKRYSAGSFECIIIYGRRRVGKTSLINEFCKDKQTIYFSALDASMQENLSTLSKAIYASDHPDALSAPKYGSLDDALTAVTTAAQKRLVFVIDEYPYLAKADPSVSSRLQHQIDHAWKDSRLFLILCGSSMSFMENQVLGYQSPLYGRRTAQFKIEPMRYREITVFYPHLDLPDQALLYGITGGIPHYVNKLCVQDSLDDALLENLFDRSSYLFEEPGNLLKQELREPALYNTIIRAIAEGASRLNEIATKAGMETGSCTKYLKVLMDLGIIKKECPAIKRNDKKTIYKIADQFFRFWYRFVPQNITAVQSGRIARIYEATVKKHLPDYMGLVFEDMCRDYLLYYAKTLPFDPVQIGQWWGTDPNTHKQIQIDIVAASAEDNAYIIGSCKYRNEKTGVEELELIREYASVFASRGEFYYFIFSKAGFTPALKELGSKGEVYLLTLEDIYKT